MCNKYFFLLLAVVFAVAEEYGKSCIGLSCADKKGFSVSDGDLELDCTPGSKWRENCNRCVCSDIGHTICTNWPCNPYNLKDVYKPNRGSGLCHLGEIWNKGCNLCMCIGFGRVSCTDHLCKDLQDPRLNVLDNRIRIRRGTGKTQCIPGTAWTDECNLCWCLDDSTYKCTYKGCYPKSIILTPSYPQTRTTGDHCKNDNDKGNKWEDGCDICQCNSPPTYICKRKYCPPIPGKHTGWIGSMKRKREVKQCIPGTTWNDDCNTCSCSTDGIAECTEKACFPDAIVSHTHGLSRFKREERKCIAGTTWKDGCNTCYCSANGVYRACTKNYCLQESDDKTVDLSKRDTEKVKRCVPGTTWNDDCNTCSCSADGIAACTEKACLPDAIVSDTHALSRYKREEENHCIPGVTWKIGCNICYCDENGIFLACTKNFCLKDNKEISFRKRSDKAVCTQGDEWDEDCYHCVCDSSPKFTCKRVNCEVETRPLRKREVNHDLFSFKQCIPGTSWKNGCNNCFCSDNGIAACTNKRCFPLTISQTQESGREVKHCVPGTSWKNDCNKCFCTVKGKAACTRKRCRPVTISQTQESGRYKQEEDDNNAEEVKAIKDVDEPQTIDSEESNEVLNDKHCVPGTSWKNDCNNCFCTVKGKAACTRKRCRPQTISQTQESGRYKREEDDNNAGEVQAIKAVNELQAIDSGESNETNDCVIGSTVNRGCNICRCTSIGLACTKRLCYGLEKSVTIEK